MKLLEVLFQDEIIQLRGIRSLKALNHSKHGYQAIRQDLLLF